MSHNTHTHWRMTINNYDDTDLALVQQGYPDHIRQMVYTLERGDNGTPHVQAYIKMKRDCRLSHMRKLYPRGNFGFLTTAEYTLNSQRYAQKLDKTAESPAVIQNGDPFHTIEGMVKQVMLRIIREYDDEEDLDTARRWAERQFVTEDYTMAKTFVSSTYKTMWREFGHDMLENIRHTHTHTHTRDLLSHLESHNNGERQEDNEAPQGSQEGSSQAETQGSSPHQDDVST